MSYSKLSIINRNLSMTGENVVAAEDNGAVEWKVCSPAYDQWVKHLLQEHDWKFATYIDALSRTGDSPDEEFEDAYALPNGCLHIVWVKIYDASSGNYQAVEYRIVGNQICLTDGSATLVEAKYVEEPDPDAWPPMFVSSLDKYVQSAIYRGLKRDQTEARALEKDAAMYLQNAKTRVDQQEPKRAMFRSNLAGAGSRRRV